MKVILKQDVANIGRRLDVVEVPDGYALNKLLPHNLAEQATAEALKRIEKRKQVKADDQASENAVYEAAVAALQNTVLPVPADANEKGHLFKAVSVDDVVTAASAAGVALLPQHVHLAVPIKTTGEHTITLACNGQTAVVPIAIVAKQ